MLVRTRTPFLSWYGCGTENAVSDHGATCQPQVIKLTDRWQFFHFEGTVVGVRVLDAVLAVHELEGMSFRKAQLQANKHTINQA